MIKIVRGESVKDIEESINSYLGMGYTMVDSLQIVKRQEGKGPKCDNGVSYTEINYLFIQVMKKA